MGVWLHVPRPRAAPEPNSKRTERALKNTSEVRLLRWRRTALMPVIDEQVGAYWTTVRPGSPVKI